MALQTIRTRMYPNCTLSTPDCILDGVANHQNPYVPKLYPEHPRLYSGHPKLYLGHPRLYPGKGRVEMGEVRARVEVETVKVAAVTGLRGGNT